MKKLAILALLGLVMGFNAIAQNGSKSGPPAFAKELPLRYAILALADTNQDKTLDTAEQADLVTAIKDGSLNRPAGLPTPPAEAKITPERIVERLAVFYAQIAVMDTNNNGVLDDNEKPAIRQAIRQGKLQLPFMKDRGKGSTDQ